METRPPLPPFTRETAIQKIRLAEDGWNTRDPARVVLAYSPDTRWRNRVEFPVGRAQAQALEKTGQHWSKTPEEIGAANAIVFNPDGTVKTDPATVHPIRAF